MSVVIKVENLSKLYRLGDVGTGTISHDVNRWWHRIMGKEDPYLNIGETNDRASKGSSDYVWALKDINFEVKQGEVLGIIGRNGAGKSTLLKILSRTTAPTTGSVKIKGRVASLLEVGTGFHPELSGRDNIFLNGAIMGMTRREIQSKFDEIVDFAGVERYIDTPVKRYSSGMYVRLAFAVAAHLEPEILIVDEVLAVGDAEFQKKCLGKMKDVSEKQGRTVLFVSHNLEAVKSLCDRGIILERGIIVDKGHIDIIYTNNLNSIKSERQYRVNTFNHSINQSLSIRELTLNANLFDCFSKLQFNLIIDSMEINPFESLCLLIYNENEQRISVIDLRSFDLFSISKTDKTLHVKGEILSLPLVLGEYSLGLAIGSKLYTGDILNLVHFAVSLQNLREGQTQYPKSSLGYINLNYRFSYE